MGSSTTWRFGGMVVSVALLASLAAACGDDSSDASGDTDGGGDDAPEETSFVFPGEEWAEADPEEMGFDPAQLEELAAEAEAEESSCLLVTRQGQLVAEWYWGEGETPTTTHEAFSATKSYTSTLVGIAQEETDLALDDLASEYIDEWEGTPSEDITIRNLVSNDSGRAWQLADYVGIVTAEDATDYALGLGQAEPPGSTWLYNDGAIQTLEVALEETTGMTPAEYAEQEIFEPIGAQDSHLTDDPSGNTLMFFALQSTCRDMARFGYLFLRDGSWDGAEVLPEGWVEEATGQPSTDLSAAYGYLWWLNRQGPQARPGGGEGIGEGGDEAAEGQLVPGAPEDMYWAQGLGGQTIQVDPASETVVVRLGSGDPAATYGSADTARIVTEALVEP